MTISDLSEQRSLNIALLTVSDTRTKDNDSSGDFLEEAITMNGHYLANREIVTNNFAK